MNAIQIIESGLANLSRNVDRALDGLSVDEIAWQPRPDANSIGLILFHMARSEDGFINRLIQHKPELWETENWCETLHKPKTDAGSHYTAEQVASFCIPDFRLLRDYQTAVRRQTMAYIRGLTPEQLDAKVDLPPHLPFEPVVGLMLMRNVTHQAGHTGEIAYIRGLQRGMDK